MVCARPNLIDSAGLLANDVQEPPHGWCAQSQWKDSGAGSETRPCGRPAFDLGQCFSILDKGKRGIEVVDGE